MPIIRDKEICFGQPILQGRRLTVFNIVFALYSSHNLGEYLEEYQVDLSEVKDAVSYCKNTHCNEFKHSDDKYCDGCILRTISEGISFDKKGFNEVEGLEKITISKDEKFIFLGSMDELDDSEFGSVGWMMAEQVEKKYNL